MIVTPIQTRILQPPKDNLLEVIQEVILEIPERSVLVVSSKVVSIWQGRCIAAADVSEKEDLIVQEADYYIPKDAVPGKYVTHTLTNGMLVSSAGVDSSNGAGHYILWPEQLKETAEDLLSYIRYKYKKNEVGVIISDSRSLPFRRGSVGTALSFAGFKPLGDYRNKRDIFGKYLQVAVSNIADAVAAAAVVAMGEGAETTPIALISDIPFVEFVSAIEQTETDDLSLIVKLEEDIFAPFFNSVEWKEGKHGAGNM